MRNGHRRGGGNGVGGVQGALAARALAGTAARATVVSGRIGRLTANSSQSLGTTGAKFLLLNGALAPAGAWRGEQRRHGYPDRGQSHERAKYELTAGSEHVCDGNPMTFTTIILGPQFEEMQWKSSEKSGFRGSGVLTEKYGGRAAINRCVSRGFRVPATRCALPSWPEVVTKYAAATRNCISGEGLCRRCLSGTRHPSSESVLPPCKPVI